MLDGENEVLRKKANFVATLSDHGLSRFAFDGLMQKTGWQGKEAVGGKLVLTTYRLIFTAHALNRLTGSLSIPLVEITGLDNRSSLFVKRLAVSIGAEQYEFVVWGVPRLIAAVEAQRAALLAAPQPYLHALHALHARSNESVSGLHVRSAWESANRVLGSRPPSREAE